MGTPWINWALQQQQAAKAAADHAESSCICHVTRERATCRCGCHGEAKVPSKVQFETTLIEVREDHRAHVDEWWPVFTDRARPKELALDAMTGKKVRLTIEELG